jgi:arsenite-transporting ATPase
VNASLASAEPREPLLLRRAHAEMEQIEKVRHELAQRTFVVPWSAEEPVGPDRLRRLAGLAKARAAETRGQA